MHGVAAVARDHVPVDVQEEAGLVPRVMWVSPQTGATAWKWVMPTRRARASKPPLPTISSTWSAAPLSEAVIIGLRSELSRELNGRSATAGRSRWATISIALTTLADHST
jgi:hypothetical protein